MYRFLGLCLIVLLHFGGSFAAPADKLHNDGLVQLCGSMLTDHIALVCDHMYNSRHSPIKRNAELLRALNRPKRGIVDECCYNACLLSNIALYCEASR